MLSFASRTSLRFAGRALSPTLALSFVALAAPAAHAQANLAFTGGNGTPLTLSLLTPVTYTVTTAGSLNLAPVFVFQSVGNPIGNNITDATGTLAYRINGGAIRTINRINSGVGVGSLSANDTYVFGDLPGVRVGDIVSLLSGTLTTNVNIAAAAPTNGSYTTFLLQGNGGTRLSPDGVAVTAAPEPGSIGLVLVGGGGLCAIVRRRTRVC